MSIDWRKKIHVPYPYKGNVLTDPQYREDRKAIEIKHGNGWWCNDGKGWEMYPETNVEYQKRRRKERELE
jgi:hypothetical protein